MYKFGLFGHPVSKSFSPRMHTASFRALGLDATYEAFDVLPAELAERLDVCRREGFTGLNLTMPLKSVAMPLMARIDPVAQLAGAINVVRFDADGYAGFNTDVTGFLAALHEDCGITPEGRRVLVVGCGGAGRAVALGCAHSGAATIALGDSNEAQAQQLAQDLARVPDCRSHISTVTDFCAASRDAELVVHCTPAGLHGDTSPLPPEAFRPGQVLYDVVYAMPVTPTMRVAQAAGAVTTNGLGMLLHQGAYAFKIWTGMDADINAMRSALEHEGYG